MSVFNIVTILRLRSINYRHSILISPIDIISNLFWCVFTYHDSAKLNIPQIVHWPKWQNWRSLSAKWSGGLICSLYIIGACTFKENWITSWCQALTVIKKLIQYSSKLSARQLFYDRLIKIIIFIHYDL